MKGQKSNSKEIYLCFIKNEWKSFFRGKGLVQEGVTRFLLYAFFVLILYSCAVLSNQLNAILSSTGPTESYLGDFYVITPIYFFFDLFLRHMWQEVPSIDICSYLHLNINKCILRRYFIFRSFCTIFTLLPLFLFGPFLINHVLPDYGFLQCLEMALTIICLNLGNHFIVLYLKKNSIKNETTFLLPLVFFVLLWLLNRQGVISIKNIIETISIYFNWPIIILIFSIFWFLISLFIMLHDSKSSFYFDPPVIAHGKTYFKNIYRPRGQTNVVAKLVETEIKMFLRNKRARSLFYTALFTLVYGYIVFQPNFQPQNGILFISIASIIMSGLIVNNYAQNLLAWQSGHFEFLMVINTDIREIFKSKFIVCYLFCTLSFILLLPFVWSNTSFLLSLLSAFLYNIGVQPVLASLLATFNYKGVDINQADNFNYQGLGAPQFTYVLVNAILAAIIYLPFSFLNSSLGGIIAIAFIGLVNIILKNWWLGVLIGFFNANKYKLLDGFRIKK